MQDHIFREYDIRGKVGTELQLDRVYDLARAIAWYFLDQEPTTRVVAVGMDGRTHSPQIKEDLSRGLRESGLDVVFVGVCPTPTFYFSLYQLPVDAGVMVTASHNPKEYNGFKLVLNKEAVAGTRIKEILTAFKAGKSISNQQVGVERDDIILDRYIDWLVDHFKHLKDMKLRALIDCGNGAAGTVVPQLVERMQWQHVDLLYPEVDGSYPNHEADPTKEENMQDVKERLATGAYDVGVGFDGDCDRMGAMTPVGYLIPGDRLLALFIKPILEKHAGRVVVFDIKSSAGLSELIEQWGGVPQLSPAGHSYIKQFMKEHNAVLGGELSCHFNFADRYYGFDDGIYAALRLFELLLQSDASLEELLAAFPAKQSSPEFRLPCEEADKKKIVQAVHDFFTARDDAAILTIDGVRAQMTYGWGLIRPSNTQAMVSLRFESDTSEGLLKVKEDFTQALKGHFEEAVLRQEFGV